MTRTALFLAVLLALFTLSAARVSAHSGDEPAVIVPTDHILAGEPFQVIVTDMGPGATVRFQLVRDQSAVPLEVAVAGDDGHLTTTLSVPEDAPDGYVQLVATGDDGTSAATWVLVGQRAESTGAPPATNSLLTDLATILIGTILIVGAALIVWTLILPRGRRRRT